MSDARDIELQKVKDKLKANQDAIAGLQQENTGIQAQIRIFETHQAELKNATGGYDKVAAAMKHELDGYKALTSKKLEIAEFAIKELKERVDKKIADFKEALEDQGKAVEAAGDAARRGSADSDAATQALRDKQSAYTALQSGPKTLETKLKDLKVLIDEVAKFEAQNDFVAMYVYLHEAHSEAANIVISPPDDYEKQLIASQSDIETLSAAAAAKKTASDEATNDAAEKRKAYDAARASRRADLLKALGEVKAPAPAKP
jgi:hypothetical protein